MANKGSRTSANWTVDKDAYKNLLSQDGVDTWIQEITAKVLDRAKQIARQEAYESGAYLNSFTSRTEKSQKKGDRTVGIVEVTDNKWHWIEYGTRRTAAKAVLRRAVDETKGGKL